jgi:catechol 2,3-dioxygenase-like lactoylglutathione lyase family enzyme
MTIKNLDHINIVTLDMPATLHFYCSVLGLVNKPKADRPHNAYLCADDNSRPVVHVMDATFAPKTAAFKRLAVPSPVPNTQFRTGPIDHVAFIMNGSSYEDMVKRMKQNTIDFQCYEHKDTGVKQIWALDPNGIRVELNFN